MSGPVPTHLEAELAEYERYGFEGDVDRRMRLFADLIVANAVPAKDVDAVQRAINDGWLSPSGDVLKYAEEDPGYDPW